MLTVCSCKKDNGKTTVAPIKSKHQSDGVIYSTKLFEPHIQFNTELSTFELIELKNPKSFTEIELTYPVKQNEFEFNKTNDFKYYTPFTFNFEGVSYNLIAYYSYGENDSKVLNIQINSYLDGKQIDALLLDCRFTAETEYYREFTIKKEGTIVIKKVLIDGLNYNAKGDIIGQKTVKDTTSETIRYKMNTQGTFKKV